MLFLLKRTVVGSLLGLVVLTALGLGLRAWRGEAATPLTWDLAHVLLGVGVVGAVLCGDGLLHGALWLGGGEAYLKRYRELAGLFRGQSTAAMVCGALMAGVGEELVFRGLGTEPLYLAVAAVVFGLLHHIRLALWPFTLWSIWEGLMFALTLWLTGALVVTMVAHFLHDVIGFVIFHWENGRTS